MNYNTLEAKIQASSMIGGLSANEPKVTAIISIQSETKSMLNQVRLRLGLLTRRLIGEYEEPLDRSMKGTEPVVQKTMQEMFNNNDLEMRESIGNMIQALNALEQRL